MARFTISSLLLAAVQGRAAASSLYRSAQPSSPLSDDSRLDLDLDLQYKQAQNGPCAGNTPTTRSSWCDHDISTDYYNVVPDTGVTREYWFVLSDHETLSPDGVPRYTQSINGTVPGPTLIADWGDEVVVHLTNNLTRSINGTSLHFHGMRQLNTNQNDGVASITQCPTPPGDSMTYRWRATQYGSSWYHSHFDLQAWEGMFGGILINGPASANYDQDLGNLFLFDWPHQTPDAMYRSVETQGPPMLSNALINGTNVYGQDGSPSQTGSRFKQKFEAGQSYRIRLVNSALDTHFRFGIDNHTMTVIATDLVPIEPYTTDMVSIGIGQRYDVIVKAEQGNNIGGHKSFWMRAIPQDACSKIETPSNVRGVVYYGDTPETPTTFGHAYTDSCADEPASKMVPVVRKDVQAPTWMRVDVASVNKTAQNVYRWYLNSTSMQLDWTDPTLSQVYNRVSTYARSDAVMELDKADAWSYVVIETVVPAPHPVHLHGFDFHVLVQGEGPYNPADKSEFKLTNPVRRDTAMLPAGGHIVVAFKTDNPGSWLMHCHIGWHTSMGFAMQFVVRKDDILRQNMIDYEVLNGTCAKWKEHVVANHIILNDSGI